jgi:hypothetical protein
MWTWDSRLFSKRCTCSVTVYQAGAASRDRGVNKLACETLLVLTSTLPSLPRNHRSARVGIQQSRVLLEELTVPQLVKKFSAFYGTRSFTTTFTRAYKLSLCWVISVQSRPLSHFLVTHFNMIILSTLRSSKWSPSLMIHHKNPVCTSPLHRTCLIRAHLIFVDFIS